MTNQRHTQKSTRRILEKDTVAMRIKGLGFHSSTESLYQMYPALLIKNMNTNEYILCSELLNKTAK